MKNKILSLVSCLAICLSLVLSVLPATVAEDAPITGVTAHAVGGCWDPSAWAVDGNVGTQWHTQMGGWGAMFFDLGKAYDLTQLRLQFPSGYFGDSGKIGTVRIDAVSRIPGKTDENGNILESLSQNDGGNGYYIGEGSDFVLSRLYTGTDVTAENNKIPVSIEGVRYIRVVMWEPTGVNGNAKIAEMSFYGTPSPVKIDGVTAVPVSGCWEAGSYAVDGRMDTQWHTAMQGWGAMFFDLGKDCDLTQLRLQFPSGYFGDGKIGTVRIDAVSRIPGIQNADGNLVEDGGSNNNTYYISAGSDFVLSHLYTATDVTAEDNKIPVTAEGVRYIRVVLWDIAGVDGNAKIAEMSFFGTASPVKVEGVTAHAVGGCWDPSAWAVDGNVGTQWHTQMGGWGAMFFDLGKAYDLTQLRLQFPSGYFGDGKIGTLRIDAVSKIPGKTDGNGDIQEGLSAGDGGNGYYIGENSDFVLSRLYTGTDVAAENNKIPVTAEGVRYIRVVLWDIAGVDGNAKIAEMSFYGAAQAEPSHDATLSALQVNGTAVEGFAADKLDYAVTLPVGTTEATVTATANDPSAAVAIENVTGDPDGKTAKVTVTAEDGTTQCVYTVAFTVEQPASDDATLSALFIGGRPFPGFRADNLSYTYPVDPDAAAPVLTATAANAGAAVSITNVTAPAAGKTATVTVTAADGTTKAVYAVTYQAAEKISVKKAYAAVAQMQPPALAVDGDLSTAFKAWFDWGILYLDLGATYDISRVQVAFPAGYLDKNGLRLKVQTISVLPGVLEKDTDDVLVMPDGNNGPMIGELDVTDTLFSARVTETDGSGIDAIGSVQGRYLRVFIEDNQIPGAYAEIGEVTLYGSRTIRKNDATLSSLTVDGKEIGGFDPEKTDYTYPVTAAQSEQLTVAATPTMEGATVEIRQTGKDPAGKTATVTVTALDGTTKKTYTVRFVTDLLVTDEKTTVIGIGGAYDQATNVVDGNEDTQWHSIFPWGGLFIDLGEEYELAQLRLTFPADYALGTETVKYRLDAVSGIPGPVKEGYLQEDGAHDNLYYISADSDFVTAHLSSGTVSSRRAVVELAGQKTRYVRLMIEDYSGTNFNAKLAELQLYAHEPSFEARLGRITVNGKELSGFSPDKTGYFYELGADEAIPTVAAAALTTGATVNVTQADAVPGAALIRVVSADKTREKTYRVDFVRDDGKSTLISYGKKTVGLGSSGIPGYTVDGDEKTAYVSPQDGATVILDLGGLYRITRAQIVFADGSGEGATVALDKLSAMPAFSGRYTSDAGDALVAKNFYTGTDNVCYLTDAEARYVRLTVQPNGKQLRIAEIRLYGYAAGNDDVQLSSLTLDGEAFAGFKPGVQRFFIDIPFGQTAVPTVAAAAKDADAIVRVRQAKRPGDTATVTVTSSDGTAQAEYTLTFVALTEGERNAALGRPVLASGEQSGYPAAAAVDGKLDTSWRPDGKQIHSITVDLGSLTRVTRVLSLHYAGDPNDVYNLTVDGSVDGKVFTRIYNSHQDMEHGQSLNMPMDAAARYVRVSWHGINGFTGDPIEVTELSVYGIPMESLIDAVTVDGEPMTEFNEGTFTYNWLYRTTGGHIPQVAVKAADGVKVTIEQASSADGNAAVTVQKGDISRTYIIRMCPIGVTIRPDDGKTDPSPVTGDVRPTAAVLLLIAGAFGLTLSLRRRRRGA